MIKVELGHIETSGPKFVIAAELATMFNSMNKHGMFTKEEVHKLVDDGFMTDEELDAKVEDTCKKSGQSVEEGMAEAALLAMLGSLL